jgi:hypothetical protein
MHVLIDVDLLNKRWTISLDNAVLLNRLFYSQCGDIRDARFSEGLFSAGTTGAIGLDNVLITGVTCS